MGCGDSGQSDMNMATTPFIACFPYSEHYPRPRWNCQGHLRPIFNSLAGSLSVEYSARRNGGITTVHSWGAVAKL